MTMPAPAGATAPLVPVPTDKLERIPDGFDQMLAELESVVGRPVSYLSRIGIETPATTG